MADKKKKGITVGKNENFSEWYSQVVSPEGAELADVRYGVQGFIVHMSWGYRIIRRIFEYLEEELENGGHEPYLFPLVIKEENLQKEKEHAGFAPDVYWVETAGDKKMDERVALRPTGETQIYPVYSLWIRSHTQLPLLRYQSRHCVYRNEKTTRPFLRGREFLFLETHNVYANHEDLMTQIEEDGSIMKRVFWEKLKIPHIFFIRPQWDKFLGADNTYVTDSMMPDGKKTQLSSTHDLGINFAKAYDVQFLGSDGKKHYAHQSCFGPGIWRIMAAIIGIHGDDKGLVLPFDVSPVQIVIVPIIFAGKDELNKKVLEAAKRIEIELKRKYRVKLDRSENSPGWKFNQWEMKGVPIRIEIGPKDVENNSVVVVNRTANKEIVKKEDLDQAIEVSIKDLEKTIEARALEYFKDNTRNAETLEEIKKIINENKGFVKIPFCSIDKDGEKCAETLKDETGGADVCGIPWRENERETPEGNSKCPICGKKAEHIVHIAKSY